MLLLLVSSFKHFQTSQNIKDLEVLILSLESKQISSQGISSLLTETKSDLTTCQRNSEQLLQKIRKSRVSGYQSLKVCNENNHECNIEKNKGISHRKVLETEVDSLNLQIRNLTELLLSKVKREKQLALKLEDLRRLNNKERSESAAERWEMRWSWSPAATLRRDQCLFCNCSTVPQLGQ